MAEKVTKSEIPKCVYAPNVKGLMNRSYGRLNTLAAVNFNHDERTWAITHIGRRIPDID